MHSAFPLLEIRRNQDSRGPPIGSPLSGGPLLAAPIAADGSQALARVPIAFDLESPRFARASASELFSARLAKPSRTDEGMATPFLGGS